MANNVSKNLNAIAESYSQRVADHGSTAVAAGWADLKTQTLRFEQIYKIIDPALKNFTLSDLGCGYGAFAQAMPDELQNKMSAYNGYDISEKMIQAGQENFNGQKKYKFFCSSEMTEKTDYVVASGIFNHHFDADPDDWWNHITTTIQQMVDHADKGVAFNIMTTHVDYQENYIYYCDPAKMLAWGLDCFGRKISLHHDYNLFEFTVFITKD